MRLDTKTKSLSMSAVHAMLVEIVNRVTIGEEVLRFHALAPLTDARQNKRPVTPWRLQLSLRDDPVQSFLQAEQLRPQAQQLQQFAGLKGKGRARARGRPRPRRGELFNPGQRCYINSAWKAMSWTQMCSALPLESFWGEHADAVVAWLLSAARTPDSFRLLEQVVCCVSSRPADVAEFTHQYLQWLKPSSFIALKRRLEGKGELPKNDESAGTDPCRVPEADLDGVAVQEDRIDDAVGGGASHMLCLEGNCRSIDRHAEA
eukprot:Skav218246  [mRNA]  locus=scaffold1426:146543:147717:- [translate_table: standard]